jgi:hypothetical protein
VVAPGAAWKAAIDPAFQANRQAMMPTMQRTRRRFAFPMTAFPDPGELAQMAHPHRSLLHSTFGATLSPDCTGFSQENVETGCSLIYESGTESGPSFPVANHWNRKRWWRGAFVHVQAGLTQARTGRKRSSRADRLQLGRETSGPIFLPNEII